MPRIRLALLPAVLAAALGAAEPMTTTAWDVRKEAEELLEDIDRHGDPGDLVARAQRLMQDHGADLVRAGPTSSAPLAAVVADRLIAAGLGARLAEAAESPAGRRLAELVAATAPAQALAAFARTVPGTEAALRAWRRTADLAWDHGDLRLYRDAAAASKEADDPLRRVRIAAATAMTSNPPAEVPPGLDALEQMWSISGAAPAAAPAPAANDRPRLRRRFLNADPDGSPRRADERKGVAACGDGAVAIADGQVLEVVDHLVGQALGRRLAIGEVALPPVCSRPAAVAGGAVAGGIAADTRPVLVCADPGGRELWRTYGEQNATVGVSAPLADGDLVYLAYRTRPGDKGELRLLAVRARDGGLAWDSAVAQVAPANRWGDDEGAPPAIAAHARGVVVLGNSGLLALVGSDGAVRRVWSYPVRPVEFDGSPRRHGRRGLAAGDGQSAVATPVDHPGMVLVLGPDDPAPRAYRGDNADGDVLAVQGGEAVLAGRQVAMLSLAELKVRWAAPLLLTDPQAAIGERSVLVAGADQLLLIDRRDGTCHPGRGLRNPAGVACRDGVLVLADAESVQGLGDAASFLARLRAAAAAAGNDPRPHAALAAVLAGRGDTDAAIAAWRRALELGAGPDVAERAARLLRTRIDAGGVAGGAALAELARLAAGLPALAAELPLWRGRLAEAGGDRVAAVAAYREALAAPDRPVSLPDGISVSQRLLAACGVARCGGAPAPAIDTADAASPASPASAWRVDARTHGPALVAGGIVAAYADGLLRAWNVADGRELWRRKPQRPLLGVSEARGGPGQGGKAATGVPILVLPGTSADAAGLLSNDVLLTLNGQELHSFAADLRPAVQALGAGSDFTFTVQRGDQVVTITGVLGGEPVEPLACDGRVVLARAVNPTMPGRPEPRFFAIDAATGAELWSHTLAADEDRLQESRPLLAAGGVIMATDGPDLVGLGTAQPHPGARLWTLAGRADLLARVRPIGRCAWLAGGGGEGVLLDPADGAELAVLPGVDPESRPALAADAVAVRDADGLLAVWDLGRGRLRSRSAAPATPLALRGDSVLAVDARNRAVVMDAGTGGVRRVIGEDIVEEWTLGPRDAFLALVAPDRRRLAAVARDGLSQRWSLDLPAGVEVAALAPWRDGLIATVREGSGTWALLVDGDGIPVGATGWDARGDATADDPGGRGALPAGAGAVVAAVGGLRAFLPGLPPAPPAVRCLDLGTAEPPRAALAAKAGALAWSDVPGGRCAVARAGIRLVVCLQRSGPAEAPAPRSHTIAPGETLGAISKRWFGDANHWRAIVEANPGLRADALRVGQVLAIPPADGSPAADLALRVADITGSLVRDASLAGPTPTGMRTFVPGAWSLAESWVVPGEPATVCSLWTPLPSRAPGTPLALLAGSRQGADLPWWLSAGWTRVLDPP